jgi:hypothetical protein
MHFSCVLKIIVLFAITKIWNFLYSYLKKSLFQRGI